MNDSSSEWAGILQRCQSGIAEIFRQAATHAERAGALADLLRQLTPYAAWTACSLSGEGTTCLAIRPESDSADSEQKRFFQSQLSFLDPLASGVRILPAEALPGYQVLVSSIHEEERPRGFLAMGLSVGTAEIERTRAEALLAEAATIVALRWQLAALQREQAELAGFALVGQAFVGLAHDLNNALNSMMLQASMVQMRAEPQARQDLAAIRQHGAQAAGLIRSLQHVVQQRREKSYLVDLNSVLTDVLEQEGELHRRVSLRLAESVPPLQGTHTAVKQLVRLLLESVCANTESTVTAATGAGEGGAALSLTIADAPDDLGAEGESPAAEVILWQNLDEVGRQAGQSLLRQLGGALTTERGGDGALILRVAWEQST